jgi:hypothetical protein
MWQGVKPRRQRRRGSNPPIDGAGPDAEGLNALRDRLRDPALTALLIAQCCLVFVAAPLVSIGYEGSRIAFEALLIAFAFLVFLVSRGPIVTALAALALIASLTGSAVNLLAPSAPFRLVSHTGGLSGSVLVGYIVGRAVLAPGVINAHRVLGAIVLYLNFGMIFATAYRLIWDLLPSSLSGVPAGTESWQAAGAILYFSFTTLTTIGYGDIVPVHPFARSLANLEGIIGQLYPATLLARLITLQLESRRR